MREFDTPVFIFRRSHAVYLGLLGFFVLGVWMIFIRDGNPVHDPRTNVDPPCTDDISVEECHFAHGALNAAMRSTDWELGQHRFTFASDQGATVAYNRYLHLSVETPAGKIHIWTLKVTNSGYRNHSITESRWVREFAGREELVRLGGGEFLESERRIAEALQSRR